MKAGLALQFVLNYLSFRRQCTHVQVLHSPFVYQLYTSCIRADKSVPELEAGESLRHRLLRDKRVLHYSDPGAGSSAGGGSRSVARLARHSLKPPRQVRLMHRLLLYFKPEHVVELGTNLGITAAAMARTMRMYGSQPPLLTLEGAAPVAQLAREHFEQLGLEHHISLVEGNFDDTLPSCLAQLPRLDFAFIDGNHRYEPTLHYLELCLAKVHNDSVLVFDDIYWSEEMKRAWNAVKAHPQVTVTVDLFHLGLVFFRKEQAREHFRLYF